MMMKGSNAGGRQQLGPDQACQDAEGCVSFKCAAIRYLKAHTQTADMHGGLLAVVAAAAAAAVAAVTSLPTQQMSYCTSAAVTSRVLHC
jgi:hypothetical protein